MRLRPLAWQLEEKVWAHYAHRQIRALNQAEAARVEEGVTTFGDSPRQVLLWFAPRAAALAQPRVIVFVHGGGWQGGDPSYHRFVGRHFAELGYFAVVVGYRVLPDVVFPVQLADVHAGVGASLALARAKGWTGPAILLGQSAGAHLLALLVYSGRQLLAAAFDMHVVGGLVLLGGPLSFAACRSPGFQAAMHTLVGPSDTVSNFDPLRYVKGDEAVSVLCVHGKKDYLVEYENSAAFIERVNAAGGNRGQVLLLPRAHHADLLDLFVKPSVASAAVHAWIARR